MKRDDPTPDRTGAQDDRARGGKEGDEEERRKAFLERARALI